jgi:uncharacterized protein (TIGR00290 family)
MTERKRVALSWSSGKDSAWSLHVLRQDPRLEVVALITSFNTVADRVAMHAVRRELVVRQAAAVRLPLWAVELPWPCPNGVYEEHMKALYARAVADGIEAIAYGDLYLRDIREYREKQLQGTGLEPLFPLWGLPTRALAEEMIAGGIRAKLTCVDPNRMDRSFVGREFDAALLGELPCQIDPCGENGEFHTFVWDAPVFSQPVRVTQGEVVERDGFVFSDLQ